VGYKDDTSRADGGYFRVKNSWGTGWGDIGYFYIGYSQLGNPVYFGEWTIAYSTPTLPSPPAAPSSLNAASVSSSQINLYWTDGSTNEDGFKIERCTGSTCTNFSQITTVGADVKAYNNTGLAASTAYSYRVRAYNTGGDSAYSNTASAMTQAAQPPAAPTSLTATAASSSQINLTWTDNSSNETGFKIERCDVSPCSSFSPLATVGASVKSYSNTGLKANTSYTYRVWAYNAGGESAHSDPASATTLCSCSISPTSKSFAAAGGPGTVTVTTSGSCSWTAVSKATWITITNPGSGLGSGSFTYSVAKNTGTRRTGTITVAGQIHTVTQAKK